MYCVVKIGGNQYKVSLNEKVEIDKLPQKDGEVVKFPALLVVDGEKTVVGPEAGKIIVQAKVLRTYKGEKVDVNRFHHKTRHRRHIGFRPTHTELEIISIGDKKSTPVKAKIETKTKVTSKTKKTA